MARQFLPREAADYGRREAVGPAPQARHGARVGHAVADDEIAGAAVEGFEKYRNF